MELNSEHIAEIKLAFKKMQTMSDLLKLLNKVGDLTYGETFRKIELHKLTYYAQNYVKENKDIIALLNNGDKKLDRSKNAIVRRYTEFTIKKKSGKERIISAPVGSLKTIQRCLKVIFEIIFTPHHKATGFTAGKSIIDNAKFHVGRNYVYNIDLKDFFPSIQFHQIKYHIHGEPFCLAKEKNSPQENLAFIITKLCTHQITNADGKMVDVLPQGAPTSPILSNLVCQKLDRRLHGLAKRFNVNYSRYADDITFSSDHSVYTKNSEFLAEMNRIIADQKFTINQEKVRLQRKDYRQEVTGLTVNTKPNVSKAYIKNLRAIINNWEKKGFSEAERIFLENYSTSSTSIKKAKPNMTLVVQGKLDYLKMVKGEDNELYKKLKHRFDVLLEFTDPINQVISIWENEGIEQAMEVYYKDKSE